MDSAGQPAANACRKIVDDYDPLLSLVIELSYPFETRSFLDDDREILFSSMLMKETVTDIVCCPSTTNSIEVIHNVMISGSLASNIETARLCIRDHLPIEYVIGCRADRVNSLGQTLLKAHFSSTFGVKLGFKLISEDLSYQVYIRGHRYRFDHLREAILHFCHVVQTPSESVEMEIAVSDLHLKVIRNCLRLIEDKSGARLCCPVDSNLVLLRGSLETTYMASEMLAGLTPMRLKFALSPSVEIGRVLSIARQMDIAVSVHPEDSGCDKLVLSSFEWNARYLYELGRIALGLKSNCSVLPEQRPLWTSLVDSPYTFRSMIH